MNNFAKPSRSHLLRLKEKLIKPQGSRSIADYLIDVKSVADELVLLNHPISNDDLTLYVVNGLSLTLKDISHVTVSLATKSSNNFSHPSRNRSWNSRFSPATHGPPQQNPNRSSNFIQSTTYKGRCQLCSQHGHSTRFCPSLKSTMGFHSLKIFPLGCSSTSSFLFKSDDSTPVKDSWSSWSTTHLNLISMVNGFWSLSSHYK